MEASAGHRQRFAPGAAEAVVEPLSTGPPHNSDADVIRRTVTSGGDAYAAGATDCGPRVVLGAGAVSAAGAGVHGSAGAGDHAGWAVATAGGGAGGAGGGGVGPR